MADIPITDAMDDSRDAAISAADKARDEVSDSVNTARDKWKGVSDDVLNRYRKVNSDVRRGAERASEQLRRQAEIARKRYEDTAESIRDSKNLENQDGEGACIAAKALTPLDREEFAREIVSRLGDRSWMADEFVTEPFLLEVDLPSTLSADAFAEYYESLDGIRFDLTPFLAEGTEPARLVFLALYPSGAVRGLTATVEEEDATWVRLKDASALLDPDYDSTLPPNRSRVRVVALKAP